MPNLKWLLLVIFATVVAGRRNIRPERELKKISYPIKTDYFAKFKEEVKRGCRPRPGSAWCTGKRENTLLKVMSPPHNKQWPMQKRDSLLENGHVVDVNGASNPNEIVHFAKFKEELKRGCRPRPGSAWCTGKREISEDDERQSTYDLPNETVSDEFALKKSF